jgi:hypothetical protein
VSNEILKTGEETRRREEGRGRGEKREEGRRGKKREEEEREEGLTRRGRGGRGVIKRRIAIVVNVIKDRDRSLLHVRKIGFH